MLRQVIYIGILGVSMAGMACGKSDEVPGGGGAGGAGDGAGGAGEGAGGGGGGVGTSDPIRVDPVLLGSVSIPGGLPIKVLTASIGFATPYNILHHDYDESVDGIGCNADHLDADASPPDIYPGPVDGGIVKITGYSGGKLLDGTTAPSEITCKWNAMPPSYRCGYGPLNEQGEIGPAISATPYPLEASPLKVGDTIKFENTTGSDRFGTFPVANENPTTAVVLGDINATLGTITFDPAKETTIEVSCPDTCTGLVGARITAVRKTEPKTTSGLIQCLLPLSPEGTRIVLKTEAIRTMRGCNLADGTQCDTSLEDVQIAVLRYSAPGTSVDSKGNEITNIAVAQGIAATIPLKP